MTVSEVRGTVLAYHRIRALLNQPQPLTDDTKARFNAFLRTAEDACRAVTGNSVPARWARSMVGAVLAAGLGAAVNYWRDDIPTPSSALRVFGLIGERPLTAAAAWKLMQPYVWEPALGEQTLAEIGRKASLRLHKLPPDPSPVDVLVDLTRPRSDSFSVQMSLWLAEYFRQECDAATTYGVLYRSTLAELLAHNRTGEMALLTGPAMVHGRPTREDWEDLIHGRIPRDRLALRAGYLVVRQFLTDYWEQWHKQTRAAG